MNPSNSEFVLRGHDPRIRLSLEFKCNNYLIYLFYILEKKKRNEILREIILMREVSFSRHYISFFSYIIFLLI